MGWADHEPPGGFDAPRAVPGGIEVDGHFFPLSYFDAVPAAKLRRAERKLAAADTRAKKLAKKNAELEKEHKEFREWKRPKPYPLKGPRWMMTDAGWTWHEWSDWKGWYVDTGIKPDSTKPLAQQRPEGR
jgi:hypothetical protein